MKTRHEIGGGELGVLVFFSEFCELSLYYLVLSGGHISLYKSISLYRYGWRFILAEYHRKIDSRTKKRIILLKGKKCGTCKESRIKCLLIQQNGLISCYNCKAAIKRPKYIRTEEYEPLKKTRYRIARINAWGNKCNTCEETRALALITNLEKRSLHCKNCLRDTKGFKYE
jgi:hypothetical protein